MLSKSFILCTLLSTASEAILVNYESNFSASFCDCKGTNDTGSTGAMSICRDPRLGPVQLPTVFPLLSFITDYNRFGGKQPGEWIERWTYKENGSLTYPPEDGFQLDVKGKPIQGNLTIQLGTKLDRFGSEYGRYISAADAPYDQRSLPPSNLMTPPDAPEYPYNYHIYTVLKPLTLLGGPIAPYYGQPGLGTQFFTGAIGTIMTLIEQGYLARENSTRITPGAGGEPSQCG